MDELDKYLKDANKFLEKYEVQIAKLNQEEEEQEKEEEEEEGEAQSAEKKALLRAKNVSTPTSTKIQARTGVLLPQSHPLNEPRSSNGD
jgi:CO dehydrogenase/acetyl-CoA synthase beta subunit